MGVDWIGELLCPTRTGIAPSRLLRSFKVVSWRR
jgi:hypothetical protein